jgi:hypothetical protein
MHVTSPVFSRQAVIPVFKSFFFFFNFGYYSNNKFEAYHFHQKQAVNQVTVYRSSENIKKT